VPSSDFADRNAALLSLALATEEKSLSQLTALAAAQVPGCVAASVTIWRDGELASQAASHREASLLVEIEVATGRGPLMDVVSGGPTVKCADTLTETRWPEFTAAALRMGVRSSAALSYRDQAVVALTLYGLRPGALALDQLQLAEQIVAWGGVLVGAVDDYGDARRAAEQFREAASSRAIVDQAKGILMHALGCTAEEALQRMREVSQRSNVRATEVAQRIIDAHSPRSGRPGRDGVSQLTDLATRARRRP